MANYALQFVSANSRQQYVIVVFPNIGDNFSLQTWVTLLAGSEENAYRNQNKV